MKIKPKKRPPRRKAQKPPLLKDVIEIYRGDPVVVSAVWDFITAFARLTNILHAYDQFTPASEEDRARERRNTSWPDPRRTAARRPWSDEPDEDEEDV